MFAEGAGVGAEWIRCEVAAEFSMLKLSFEAGADFGEKTFIAFEGSRLKSCLVLRSCEVIGHPSAADSTMFMGSALVQIVSGVLIVEGCTFNSLRTKSVLLDCAGANSVSFKTSSFRSMAVGLPVLRGGAGGASVILSGCNFRNESAVHSEGSSSSVPVIAEIDGSGSVRLLSVSCSDCSVEADDGTLVTFESSNFAMESCDFNGKITSASISSSYSTLSSSLLSSSIPSLSPFTIKSNANPWFLPEQVCARNGSMVKVKSSGGAIKNTTFSNSTYGALSVHERNIELQEMKFVSNWPREFGMRTTARRNVLFRSSSIRLASQLNGRQEAQSRQMGRGG